jgi:hypothetical protein
MWPMGMGVVGARIVPSRWRNGQDALRPSDASDFPVRVYRRASPQWRPACAPEGHDDRHATIPPDETALGRFPAQCYGQGEGARPLLVLQHPIELRDLTLVVYL